MAQTPVKRENVKKLVERVTHGSYLFKNRAPILVANFSTFLKSANCMKEKMNNELPNH